MKSTIPSHQSPVINRLSRSGLFGSLPPVLVQRLAGWPRFFVAKGGITSSELATKGLGVKRAVVLGQILPGVPVWELGPETKFPRTSLCRFSR